MVLKVNQVNQALPVREVSVANLGQEEAQEQTVEPDLQDFQETGVLQVKLALMDLKVRQDLLELRV